MRRSAAAAIIRLAHPTRFVRWLTFGAPRPGDEALRNLLSLPTRGCALANSDDAITAIPPDIDSIIPAETILGRQLTAFAEWKPPRETWRQLADGSIEPNVYPSLTTQELIDLLEHVWTQHTFFDYPAHRIREYQRRIRLRCPGARLSPMVRLACGSAPLLGSACKALRYQAQALGSA